MKPRLQTSLGQHLVLTPQLRQALHLLQLSAVELETEIAALLAYIRLEEYDYQGAAAIALVLLVLALVLLAFSNWIQFRATRHLEPAA